MRAAIDCDLRRLHGLSDADDRLFYQEPSFDRAIYALAQCNPRLVLFEIASAVHYDAAPNKLYNKNRWSLWNMAMAAMFHRALTSIGIAMLVSPSSDWSRGYTEKERQTMAKCRQPNHDLREAEAMLFFHRVYPQAWRPLPEYLEKL